MGSTPEKPDFIDYMNGGGCKESFTALLDCKTVRKKGEKLIPECREETRQLMKCMNAHTDYYQPWKTIREEMKNEIVLALQGKIGDKTDIDIVEFMKGGGCEESYMALKDCKDADCRRDCVSKLRKCMTANSGYFPGFPTVETVRVKLLKAAQAFSFRGKDPELLLRLTRRLPDESI